MYGGDDLTQRQNSVTKDRAQGGSTFKPFTLVAALEAGVSLDQTFDGSSGRRFEGYGEQPVGNFGDTDYGTVDLVKATANSVNTAYVELNEQVGPAATREVAVRAGLPGHHRRPAGRAVQRARHGLAAADRHGPGDGHVRRAGRAAGVARRRAGRRAERRGGLRGADRGLAGLRPRRHGQRHVRHDPGRRARVRRVRAAPRAPGGRQDGHEQRVAAPPGSSATRRSWPRSSPCTSRAPRARPEPIVIPGTRNVTGGSYPVRIWTGIMEKALAGAEVLRVPGARRGPPQRPPVEPGPLRGARARAETAPRRWSP